MPHRPRGRRRNPTGFALIGVALLALASCQNGTDDRELPNILLISIDTLRPDHMGCYGYDKDTTPRLDALAKEGVLFQDVFAPRGSTWPSLTSLLTGKFPINHGVRRNGLHMVDRQITLPEILKENGYQTGAFLSNFYDANPQGFVRMVAEVNPMQLHRDWDRKNVEMALEWLEQKKDLRTFTWVHLMDPHRPYDPTSDGLAPFAGGYDGWLAPFLKLDRLKELAAEGLAPITLEQIDEYLSYRDPSSNKTRSQVVHSSALRGHLPLDFQMEMITLFQLDISDEDLAFIVANYDAQIPPADALLGQVLDKIDELGMRENTLVIFTTDHGDDLFEHNKYFFHGASIYDSTLRVAWSMRWPGVLDAGRVVDGPLARNVDVMPTILELIGIQPPSNIDGVSAADMLLGKGSYEPGPVVMEWEDKIYALRDHESKFINNRGNVQIQTPPFILLGTNRAYEIPSEGLFDLQADPNEQNNLLDAERARLDPERVQDERLAAVENLISRLRTRRDKDRELFAWLEDQNKKPRPKTRRATDDVIKTLEGLGYIGGGVPGRASSSFSSYVRELAQGTFDAADPKTARHYELLAESQWLDGDSDSAQKTVQAGLADFAGAQYLKKLEREVRTKN